jgi:hypothetical protein
MRCGALAAVGSMRIQPLSGEPGFGPGVGVGLADDEGAVHRVDLAALVARYDPGRDAGGA